MHPDSRILLLDVDGVLVIPPEYFGVHLLRENEEAARAFFEGPFKEASLGRADLMEQLPALIAALGRDQTPQALLREWLESENHPNRPLWEAVRELRWAGWRAFLATNQEAHRTRHLLREVGLDGLVDGTFASCEVGHRKPDPAYYAEVGRRLSLSPGRSQEQIVFWDDSPENVDAARKAGWTAHLYRDPALFRQVMGLSAP